jgi:hypothetical protein
MRKWITIAVSTSALLGAAPLAAQQKPEVTSHTTTEATVNGQPIPVHQTTTNKGVQENTTYQNTSTYQGAQQQQPQRVQYTTETTTEISAEPPTPMRTKRFRSAIVEVENPGAEPYYATGFGMAITAGGGATGYLEPDARSMTRVGPGWDARLHLATRSIIGGEVGYFGGLSGVRGVPGLDANTDILRQGVEAAARLNVVSGLVQPYLLGGVGWTNSRITGTTFNNSDVSSLDNFVHFPVGAGIGFHYRGLLVDTRGVFRPTFGDTMLNAENARMHTWEGKLNAGWEF